MNLKFVVNDYMLIWNILYQASINKEVHKAKQKLWVNYKEQYNKTTYDIISIYKENKNFLPDDDTLYNLIFELPIYDALKKETEKYKMRLLKFWDGHKKQVNTLLKKLLRFDLKPYTTFVVHPDFDVIELSFGKEKINGLCIGTKIEESLLIEIVLKIVKNELKGYREDYQDMVDAIIELAVTNEFATLLTGNSAYMEGDKTLRFLKRQLYPYWLMYLGADHEEMLTYMMRDKIVFDTEKYTVEPSLKKVDLFSFVDFCIKNQRYIIKLNELDIH